MDRFVRERDTMRLISAGQAINKTLKLPQMWKHERITIYATFLTVRFLAQVKQKNSKQNKFCICSSGAPNTYIEIPQKYRQI